MTAPRRPAVALATYAGLPDLSPDDQLLRAALERAGIETSGVAWDATGARWASYRGVMIRSCWDYHLRLPPFLGWVGRLERLGVSLWNSGALIRWNAHKGYLRELETAGIPVVPTEWLRRGQTRSLATVLDQAGWTAAVVKPTVSASALDTWRTSVARVGEDQARFEELVGRADVMVQPFLPEIESEGEWSIVFVEGAFSHAVLKRPKPGDFRVQRQHGGAGQLADPGARLLEEAAAIVARTPEAPLFARVDGCVVAGRLLLMELELIEPELFLGSAPGAAERLAEAVRRRLER